MKKNDIETASKELQKTRSEQIKILNNKFVRDCKDLIKQDLLRMQEEEPSVAGIVLRGYTPGFNDGDPCVHYGLDPSYSLSVKNGVTFEYHMEYEKFSDRELLDQWETENGKPIYDDEQKRLNLPDIGICYIAEEFGELIGNTDFKITITIKDGELDIEQDYWGGFY